MVKHRHKAGESLIGMPEEVLIRYEGDYFVGYATGSAYDAEAVLFTQDDDFDWYDLTELGE